MWRDKAECTCCVHGTGAARGSVTGRRDGVARVWCLLFSHLSDLACLLYPSASMYKWELKTAFIFSFFILLSLFLCNGMGIPGSDVHHTHTLLLSVCRESCPGEANHGFGRNSSTWAGLGVMREDRTEDDLCHHVLCCTRAWLQSPPCSTDAHSSLCCFPEVNFKLPETLLPFRIKAQKWRKDTMQVQKAKLVLAVSSEGKSH